MRTIDIRLFVIPAKSRPLSFLLLLTPLSLAFVMISAWALRADSRPSGSDTPSVPSGVKQLLESLANYQHVRIVGVSQAGATSTKIPGKISSKTWGKSEYSLVRDGSRLFVSETQKGPKAEDPVFQTDQRLDKNGLLYISDRLTPAGKQYAVDLIVSLASEEIAGRKGRRTELDLLQGMNDNGLMIAYFGYFPLASYFGREAKVTEVKDGALVKVTSQSELGVLKAWLDPEFGHLPRKLELTRAGKQRTSGGRRVDEIVMNPSADIWPAGHIKQLSWAADNIKLAKNGNLPYIQSAEITHKTFSSAGPIVTVRTTIDVKQIDFTGDLADHDFESSLKIPDKYPVTIEEASYLPYIWLHGKPVPRTGNSLPSTLSGARRNVRTILIIVNSLLVMALMAFMYYRWTAAKKANT
jgi:hypothetical protein